MAYRVYNFRSNGSYGRKSSSTEEFYEAMEMTKEGMRMAKEGFEMVCQLSEEMADQFGERRGSSCYRGGYGEREDWDEMDDMYGARRRRDSRGRYM